MAGDAPGPRERGARRRAPSPTAPLERPIVHIVIWGAVAAALAAAWLIPDVRRLVRLTIWRMNSGELQDQLDMLIDRWGPWAPLASILLMIAHTLVPFPAELLAAANGAAFGLWGGSLVQWIGSMASAMIGFGIARALGRPVVERHLPGHVAWVDALVRRSGWQVAVLVRFVPVFPFSIVNFALGVTPLSWRTYLWTTGVALVPWTVASVAIGVGAVQARGVLPWSVGGLALLAVAGLLIHWLLARRRPPRHR